MGMILRIASSRRVGQGDIVGRSGYFSLNLSANSVMRGRLDARRTLKSLVADLRFKTTKPSVSLAMSFKRNSLEAARMRHVAIHELGGRLLSDENVTVSPVKILDSHGNVKSVITDDSITL